MSPYIKNTLLPGTIVISFGIGALSSINFLESVTAEEYIAPVENEVVIETPAPQEEEEKEAVVITPPEPKELYRYIEVTDSCDINFEGDCLNVRSGPGTNYPAVNRIRNGAVLKIRNSIYNEEGTWHHVVFDEWIRYPERVTGSWYVSADYVRVLREEGTRVLSASTATTTKSIVVRRDQQKLYAYEGDILFMELDISTGLELTPTPRGTFHIYKKTPSRYMQGPLPGISTKYWDLPGVPWNLYFTSGGAVIHGAYWHNDFGHRASNGCVNVLPSEAEKLYKWADIGTPVIITD